MIGFLILMMVCFLIPLGAMIYFLRLKNNYGRCFFTGMAVFFLFQLVIRVPIVTGVLPHTFWYNALGLQYPFLQVLLLASTAGLFEEGGRYLGFLTLKKKSLTWKHAAAFGLGHGGMEALYIGLSVAAGYFSGMRSNSLGYLLSALERASALCIQIGFTFLVFYSIQKKRPLFLFLAFLAHTFVDSLVALGPYVGSLALEGIIAAVGLIALWASIRAAKTVPFTKDY